MTNAEAMANFVANLSSTRRLSGDSVGMTKPPLVHELMEQRGG
jgi:hypothetical protein